MDTHILVPTDGSEHAERAFEHAMQMAEQTGGDLQLLHVVDTDRYGEPALSSSELVVTLREDEGTRLLKTLDARAGERGVSTVLAQCHGDPVEEIITRTESGDVDVVVMGRQGYDHKRLQGYVAERVRRLSDVEVVLV